jgi:outer membrane protein, heavy metal efflux system
MQNAGDRSCRRCKTHGRITVTRTCIVSRRHKERGISPAVLDAVKLVCTTACFGLLVVSASAAAQQRPVLLAASTATSAQSIDALTIDQAVTEAIEHNLALLAERYNLTVADAHLVTARLRPNPVLSVEGDHLDWLGTGYDRINNAGPQEYSVRTDFVLERGQKRTHRVDVAEQAQTVARLQLQNSIRQLTLDVENACTDVRLAGESLTLARDSLAALNSVVQLNERRVRDGDLAEIELLRTQLAHLQFESTVRQAELRLRTARSKLHVLLGRQARAPLVDIADAVEPRPSIDLVSVLDRALRQRPDLLAARAEQARSQADVRLQIAQGIIDYSLGAEYRRQDGLAGRGNSIGIFFSSPLPVFNRNQGEIARARAEDQQLDAKRLALETSIRNDVETAFSQYETARATLDTLERTMLTRARDVRQITEFSYRRGEASLIEFLDAQRAYNDTMQSYNEAKADYARSLFLLGAASGSPVAP